MKKKTNINKIEEIVKNILEQHVIGKDNLTRYNLGIFDKISSKLALKVDKEQLSVNAEPNTIPVRDENGQVKGVKPTQDSHLATKEYVDEQIIAPGFVTKEYVDKQDEAVYQNAQKYTDQEIANQKQYIDAQDEANLKEAKEFADMKSIEAVQQAEGYTDTQINNLDAKKVDKLKQTNKVYATNGAGADTSRDMSSTATPNSIPIRNGQGNFKVSTPQEEQDVANKKYVDAQDQVILQESKDYTDSKIIGGRKFDLIWENANPQATFPPQHLSFTNLSQYKYFEIECKDVDSGSTYYYYTKQLYIYGSRAYHFQPAGPYNISGTYINSHQRRSLCIGGEAGANRIYFGNGIDAHGIFYDSLVIPTKIWAGKDE